MKEKERRHGGDSGGYVNKRFTEQTLKPGESVDLSVQFFVGPSILEDVDGRNLKTITLSYTFFRAKDQPAETAHGDSATEHSTN